MAKAESMRNEEDTRDSRMKASRDLETRIAELSHVPNMEYNSPLALFRDMVPDGWEYAFKRSHLKDTFDADNWSYIEQEGWQIVPASDHPNLLRSKGVNTIKEFENAYFYKGTILCKRPKVIGERRKRVISDKIYERISGLKTGADALGEHGLRPGQFLANQVGWSTSKRDAAADFDSTIGM